MWNSKTSPERKRHIECFDKSRKSEKPKVFGFGSICRTPNFNLVDLTNSNCLCRCGLTFCALHRYAEAHNCTFDYKSEGRRTLQQQNPLVAAPKLPKI